MREPIYFITTFQNLEEKVGSRGNKYMWRDSRTVGFFYNRDEAESLVRQNAMDLNEAGYYPYALVEECYEGIYSVSSAFKNASERQIWFEWNGEFKEYQRIEEAPKDLRNIFNFAVG